MAENKTPLVLSLLASSVSVADRAGKIIRDVMSAGDLGIIEKGKNDPQTEADRKAQQCIVTTLSRLYPNITVIGEEGSLNESEVADDLVTEQDRHVLSLSCPTQLANVSDDQICVWVDPLDGTSEYTQGLLDHVTVLIGIAVGKDAIGGVIHQPYYNYKSGGVLGRTIWGLKGAGVGGITFTPPPVDGRIITTTRSHSTGLVDQVLQATNPTEVLRVGGAGHKVMLLMEGKAHAYVFASGGSKRWDTCAPEVILRELGGELTDMHGVRYNYNKDTQPGNSRGVLGTAISSDHASYVSQVAPCLVGKLQ